MKKNQSPMGLLEHPTPLEGNLEIQSKLHAWITRLAAEIPDTLLYDLCDFESLNVAGVREEHVMRLSVRLEEHLNNDRIDECTYTVQMASDVLDILLPLAASSEKCVIS